MPTEKQTCLVFLFEAVRAEETWKVAAFRDGQQSWLLVFDALLLGKPLVKEAPKNSGACHIDLSEAI